MEFEEFKDIDQVKPSPREDEEKPGFMIKREKSLKANLFQMNTKTAGIQMKVFLILRTLGNQLT
jgi:uncharacterized lipoprotein